MSETKGVYESGAPAPSPTCPTLREAMEAAQWAFYYDGDGDFMDRVGPDTTISNYTGEFHMCPVCRQTDYEGHKPDCIVRLALADPAPDPLTALERAILEAVEEYRTPVKGVVGKWAAKHRKFTTTVDALLAARAAAGREEGRVSGKGITGRVWFPHLIGAEGSDFVMPNGDKGYVYCGIAGWVLYVNGECLFEGYTIQDICDWLTMLGAQAIAQEAPR